MIDAPYKLFDSVKDQLDSNLLFVEIGSERGGGSTYYLNSLSKQTGNNFITVDIDPVYLNSSVTSATMSGEEWVEQHLPLLKNPKIGLIFLDNFDWINRPTEVRNGTAGPEIYSAIEEYRKKQGEDSRKRYADPAERKRHSDILKAANASPEARAKKSEAAKASTAKRLETRRRNAEIAAQASQT
jgi:hypothetical protein